MNLDPRTLLFSLILTNALTVISLFVAATNSNGKRDGIGKWATAMLLETLTWTLIAARGTIPDAFSIIIANGLKAASHALILAAICEFQQRSLPRWLYFTPVALTLIMGVILIDDIHGRFVWGSLIYAFQMALIARTLMSDPETRAGRAWRLLFGGVAAIMLVLGLRAAVGLFGQDELAQPQLTQAPQLIQIISFIAVMSTALLGTIGFVLMIKERTDREIMHLAMTDSLTQIPNRRALMELASQALARRNGQPLALLMIDVDHFKRINDAHGHLTGDFVLREIASSLLGRLRRQDIIGRYGGEEFCVIAPDTTPEGAYTLAHSLRETIASTLMKTEHGDLSVSVSIGISLCNSTPVRAIKDVLEEADSALYTAKQDGRNRVVFFNRQDAQFNPINAQTEFSPANPG